MEQNGDGIYGKWVALIIGLLFIIVFIWFTIANSSSQVADNSAPNTQSTSTITNVPNNQKTNTPNQTAPPLSSQTQKSNNQNSTPPKLTSPITQNPTSQPAPAQNSYSASTLAANLAPQLAFITCGWYSKYGGLLFSKSSNGLLGPAASNGPGNYFVTTVLGGVMDTSYTGSPLFPTSCSISFPAGASLYAGGLSTITVGSPISTNSVIGVDNVNVDFAQVIIALQNNYLANYARKINYCSTRESISDSIAVFGYPINSAGETLTGVITGTSGYYDTTNITIPNGMEGSTAVSLTNGCVIGQINSSGQIANIQGLSYVLGF